MLGEGLTTGAPVQYATFDEAAFAEPRRRHPWTWLVGAVAVVGAVIGAVIVALL